MPINRSDISNLSDQIMYDHISRPIGGDPDIRESWQEIVDRILARIDKYGLEEAGLEWNKIYDKNILKDMLANKVFLPNTPALRNMGHSDMTMACYVLDIEDNMDSIMSHVKDCGIIFKGGGGVGANYSKIRGKDSSVGGTMGVASGPVSFMQMMDTVISSVKSGGVRRGAYIATLNCDHPDIEEFITCKQRGVNKCVKYSLWISGADKMNPCFECEYGKDCPYLKSKEEHMDNYDMSHIQNRRYKDREFTNMNISVCISNQFQDCHQRDVCYIPEGHTHCVDPAKIMKLISHCAHSTGDPGVIFLDRINEYSRVDVPITATNPCGESVLSPFQACCLGSFNINKWSKLSKTLKYKYVIQANLFLDTLYEINNYIDCDCGHKVASESQKDRKIGIGVMGWADYLLENGLPYEASPSTLEIIKEFTHLCHKSSTFVGSKLGVFYGPDSDNAEESTKIKRSDKKLKIICNIPVEKYEPDMFRGVVGKRNAVVNIMAPTGTISRIAGCSSGIEPYFRLSYYSETIDKAGNVRVNNELAAPLYKLERAILDDYLKTKDNNIIADALGVRAQCVLTANEISWKNHLNMQRGIQSFVDGAISKTINLDNSTTQQDIHDIFVYALKSGVIKGTTVFRDGCSINGVLNEDMPCPNCGKKGALQKEGGCSTCSSCGYSACSVGK